MISAIESHYTTILFLHVGCVVLSGALFTLRGLLRVRNAAVANHILLRIGAYLIDSTLLVTAILLTSILHQYPFVNGWLTAKVLLVLVYILLGSITLKRACTPTSRLVSLAAALSTFALIVGIAVAHDRLRWLSVIRC